MTHLDWPTVRAVAQYFDVDPHDIERVLATDRPHEADSGEWCEHPIRGFRRRSCGRRGVVEVGGLRLCRQHENSLLNGINWWLMSDAQVRDIENVVSHLGIRLRDVKQHRNDADRDLGSPSYLDAALRHVLTEYLDRDAATAARTAVNAMFAEASS